MEYIDKLTIANEYLATICDLSWDDLSDINSLHDAQTKEDIIALCDERLNEEDFPFDVLQDYTE